MLAYRSIIAGLSHDFLGEYYILNHSADEAKRIAKEEGYSMPGRDINGLESFGIHQRVFDLYYDFVMLWHEQEISGNK